METRVAEDGEVCQICQEAATIVVITDKGDCPFCEIHFDLCWDVIPQLLAAITHIFGGK